MDIITYAIIVDMFFSKVTVQQVHWVCHKICSSNIVEGQNFSTLITRVRTLVTAVHNRNGP